MIKDFDLTTKDGIQQAKRYIAKQRRDAAINEFHAAFDAEEDTEALENRLTEIDLLNEFQAERPHVEVIAWDKIPDVDREWLIPQWLPANTVTMFTGDGGAGKSWLTLQAICQIACGFRDAFLSPDFEKVADITTRRNVVFATYEDETRRNQTQASGISQWNAMGSRFTNYHPAAPAPRGHARHRLGVGTRDRQPYPKYRRFACRW